MLIDAAALSHPDLYKILIGSIAPRPIAWVGTRNRARQNNLAQFSFYNCFSATPPIVGFSTIPRPDGRNKDTLQNVQEMLNPELHIEGLLRTMHDSRSRLAAEVSAQLLEHFGDKVFATIVPRNVRLAEAPSHGLSIVRYDRGSKGAQAYLALAEEIVRRNQ